MKFASIAVLVVAIAVVGLSARPPGEPLRTNAGPVLPRPSFLHALFAGQQHLVADYFWVLTTYFIGAATSPEQMRDVYSYADLATELDPNFRQIYWFAGVALPVKTGRGEYANVKESTAILEKGARALPGNFKIKYQLLQNYMFYEKDFPRAITVARELLTFPDTPSWVRSLELRLHAESGDLETSLALARQLLKDADDDEARQIYETRVKEIQQEMMLRRIDAAADVFAKENGRRPIGIQELFLAGKLTTVTQDPLGGDWFLDQETGKAKSTASKHRFGLIRMREAGDPAPRN